MGLFDVFKKKDCEICGKEVGMFGYKKLEDGEICKDCVKLLSPWFEERRHSTVAQIKEQLAYREQNRNELANFHPQMRLGEHYPVHVELSGGIPSRFVVQRTNDYREENADIISFRNVRTFEIDVEEHERELKHRNSEGESVSYNPPRYNYSYDFNMVIRVNHPYFDEMRFRLNSSSVETTNGTAVPAIRKPNPRLNHEYREYEDMGKEIKEVLTQERQRARDEAKAAAAPKAAVTCPYCGATTTPDVSGCCEYCGGAVNG